MNLSFAMCDSAKESHIRWGTVLLRVTASTFFETVLPVSLLTAPVARGQKPPVGPAFVQIMAALSIFVNMLSAAVTSSSAVITVRFVTETTIAVLSFM